MGGLIALATALQKPEIIRGIVFCGTPFGPVSLIIWGLQRGAPFSQAFSADMHFASRSSYLFLPTDGKALVDYNNEDILIDYFNPQEYAFALCVL
jgi:pimeloyl-ACP methyl ester carboxylesterase